MPSSYADHIRDWESLETAVTDHVDQLVGYEENLEELQVARDEVKSVKRQQDHHDGARQKATQDLSFALDQGRNAAVKLRGFIKAKLGPRNELLNRFGIAPVRRRFRPAAEKPAPPPILPEQVKPEQP